MPNLTWLEFVETSIFTKRFGALGLHDSLAQLQVDLVESPTRWPVIAGLGGARKGRVGDERGRRGKSGSYRYIYLYLSHISRVYLLFVFEKQEQDNLSNEQSRSIAKLCEILRKECEPWPPKLRN
jgi:hypothetical protein